MGGAYSENDIGGSLDAHVSDGALVTLSSGITIQAHDDTQITAIAGAVAVTTGAGGAVGAGVSKNSITRDATAFVDDATLATVGGSPTSPAINVLASSDAAINSVAAGGAFANNFAAGGSLADNAIGGTLDAHISGGVHVLPVTRVTVKADDRTRITAVAGQVAFTTSAGASIGAALATNEITRNTTASIEGAGTTATADALQVLAASDAQIEGIAAGGTGAQSFAAGGSLATNTIAGTLDAHVDSGATATGSKQLVVNATDHTIIFGGAGQAAFVVGAGVAVGTAITTNTTTRHVVAFVGGTGSSATASSVQISADTVATIEALAAVGTGAGTIAADYSLVDNEIQNTTDAGVLDGALVSADNVSIRGSDDSTIESFSGAGAGAPGTLAAAAAQGKNVISNNVFARIDNATVNGGTIDVLASSDDDNNDGLPDTADKSGDFNNSFTDDITSIVIGGAGAGTLGLSGSISLNDIASNIDAHIGSGATVGATTSVHVRGLSDSGIRSVAANGEGAGAVAAGVASSTNNSHSQVVAGIDAANVAAPDVEVHTTTTGNIKSAAAVGAGAGTGAFDIATSHNTIANVSEAHVTNAAHVTAGQMLTVSADDDSDILAITGAGAGAGAVAIAPGVSTNDIGNTVVAVVDNGAVVHADSATVQAADNDRINSVSAGLAGATFLTITGGVGNNNIANTVDAHLSGGATITTTNDLTIFATDASVNGSFTGQAGGALVGLGAAASYSEIGGHITAYIDHATATSTAGSVNVNAVAAERVKSFTGGADGGLVGIAGNVSVVFMETRTEAYITNATVNAFANVLVAAEATDTWDVIVGALAGGLVGASGSVVVNNSANVTRAFIDNANVVAHGKGNAASVKHWDPDTGLETIEQVHGLAVVASFVGQPGSTGASRSMPEAAWSASAAWSTRPNGTIKPMLLSPRRPSIRRPITAGASSFAPTATSISRLSAAARPVASSASAGQLIAATWKA